MNGAYRVPGANEVLNTDLQTRRVFRLVFFLRSGHVEYPKFVGDENGWFSDKSGYLGVGKLGGGSWVVFGLKRVTGSG